MKKEKEIKKGKESHPKTFSVWHFPCLTKKKRRKTKLKGVWSEGLDSKSKAVSKQNTPHNARQALGV